MSFDEPLGEGVGKTEWEDALMKHGIIPSLPAQKTEDDIETEWAEQQQSKDPMDKKSLAELEELEDDMEEKVLEEYRQRRLAEMKEKAKREIYSHVTHIREADFVGEVTNAPPNVYVVLHLFIFSKPDCQLLNQVLERASMRHKAVKFLKIIANECIHNYPDKNCPTILIYKGGQIVKQIVGLGELGGQKVNEKVIEWELSQIGAIESELTEHPLSVNRINMKVQKKGRRDDSDSDSDSDSD